MLFLDRQDVVELLPIADCITAVAARVHERALRDGRGRKLPLAGGDGSDA